MPILVSAREFAGGVLRRFYFWLPAVFLDPFDLYDRFKSSLPERLQVEISFPSKWGLIALVVLLAWAAVLTFHKVRIERDAFAQNRSPQPDMPLSQAVQGILGITELWGDGSAGPIGQTLSDIRQQAHLGTISVWGRRDCPDGLESAYPLTEMHREDWDYIGISYLDFLSNEKGTTEVRRTNANVERYHDLHLNAAQVRLIWPPRKKRRPWSFLLPERGC